MKLIVNDLLKQLIAIENLVEIENLVLSRVRDINFPKKVIF